ncbi:MAG: hypothetical protein K2H45_01785 [Acetatifactor sp.]|nr:hypothetical protein [Acetatifactor sp.]
MKNCREITCEYYSKWLGQDGILCHEFSGIQYLYSEQRNTGELYRCAGDVLYG